MKGTSDFILNTSVMERRLFILLIFTGFIPLVLSVPHQYYLIQQRKIWSDAQAYCRATYTDLAIIDSNDNIVRLQNEAQKQQFSSSAWIGLYNPINSWRWSMGNEPLGTTWWCSGQPNNIVGHDECGAIGPWGWNDLDCTSPHSFVCFDVSKTGNQRYIYISTTMTWLDAQTYCRQHHTDLASSRNATEESVIQGLTSGWTWFGLFRDYWKWTDQTNFSTISWMSGKPDNALRNGNCGYINNSQAANAQCSDIMAFFCYAEITGQQQILRVKVQSEEDANDPAVMMAILEQIKEKLNNLLRTRNITVKWRKQPDGVVFNKLKGKNILP
ncbi:putative C-type lectin domain family 20 member A isoform X2 [Tachysurus fulvidraco]|uniref:putative C-type lectin domain family 20 member A isoform X2 n=1 Tax=Tachysurus fulvidraco TaxID=1234273 RepID=UPI001FEE3AE2|nr:putative C-type lectin domain family 20 member A isoform X2 [Tachysurus fulvidraco]